MTLGFGKLLLDCKRCVGMKARVRPTTLGPLPSLRVGLFTAIPIASLMSLLLQCEADEPWHYLGAFTTEIDFPSSVLIKIMIIHNNTGTSGK